jgi:hypothetical protein
MRCQYCDKRLGITQRLKREQFCCAEHRELQIRIDFERLHTALKEPATVKPKVERPEVELARSEAEQLQAPSDTKREWSVDLPPEMRAKAAQELLPAFEIGRLAEAVGVSPGDNPPQAPFLPEQSARPGPPAAAPLTIQASEPVPATIQFPFSPAPEASLGTSPAIQMTVSPAQPTVDVMPIESQPAWRSVPEGYPPVFVSATATLLLDLKGAKLLPLPVLEPCRGEGPVPPPPADAMESAFQTPALISRQSWRRPVSVFDRPPQAPASYESLAQGRLGRGPALLEPVGILRAQRDLARLVPPATPRNFGALASSPLLAGGPGIPMAPQEPDIAQALRLDAVFDRPGIRTSNVPLSQRVFALAKASKRQTERPSGPLRWEPSLVEVHSTWQLIGVTCHLPQAAAVMWSAPLRLSLAQDATSRCSSMTNLPPAVETVAAMTGTIPLLLSSSPSSTAIPALPFCSGTRPLRPEACRLPAPVTMQQLFLSSAYLHPSLPSPMSLVTWSRLPSHSIPARQPSNLASAAPIALFANQGRPHALRLWSPSRRGHVAPLMPEPNGPLWAPTAPMHASVRLPAIKAIRPNEDGTAPPGLGRFRVQPASMPVRPVATATFGIESITGLVVFGPSLAGTLRPAYIDIAHARWQGQSQLCGVPSPVLPLFSITRHAPTIGVAPGSAGLWRAANPPVQTVSSLQPFGALQRMAWALAAGAPGTGSVAPTQRQS